MWPLEPYLETYYEARRHARDEWEVFWDYRADVLVTGDTIFENWRVYDTGVRLLAYLFLYGMARNTGLPEIGSSRRLARLLVDIHTPAMTALLGTRFEAVDWTQSPFMDAWADLGTALGKCDLSQTETMRSKILLAIWGEMPAFDERFRKVFLDTFQVPASVPRLRLLQDAYRTHWKAEIATLRDELKHTLRGHRIPDARLIDIAFWLRGT
jgi:hypothetical protein